MKQAYLIAGVGVIAVIVLGVWLTMTRDTTPEDEVTQTFVEVPSETPETAELLRGQNSLRSLLTIGTPLECSFQFKDDIYGSEGTGFFDAGRMRVDSMYTASSGAVYTSSMISVSEAMYVWSETDAGTFGLKLNADESIESSQGGSATSSLSQDTNVWYECKPWNVDGSVFLPPSTITFMDMSSLGSGVPTAVTDPVE